MIGRMLAHLHPNLTIEYRWIESEGDQQTDASLAEAGGKGLFAQALHRALLASEADLAVHSMKDLPADDQDAAGLIIAAVPPRADVRDCLIAPPEVRTIDGLPTSATVGTASPRRAAQLLMRRPDLRIQLIRGNVDTRLRRVLEDHRYDATLLAAAGLQRADLAQHADRPIDPDLMLPAAAQGALAIQCRSDDHTTLVRCLAINDSATAQAVHAERQVVAGLGGDCHSAIAVLAESAGDGGYRLRARVLSPDGGQCLRFDDTAPAKRLGRLAGQAVQALRAQGADRVLGSQ